MSKVKARFSLADIARATRAAKEQGAEAVEVLLDGTIRVVISHKDETKLEADTPKVSCDKAKPDAETKVRDFEL